MEIWPKPFSFPKNINEMTWEQKVALEIELLKHNKTSETKDTSDIAPSHVFSPEEMAEERKKKEAKKKALQKEYMPIVVKEEDEGVLASNGLSSSISPQGRFVDISVVHEIEERMKERLKPEAIKDAEERFGNIS